MHNLRDMKTILRGEEKKQYKQVASTNHMLSNLLFIQLQ